MNADRPLAIIQQRAQQAAQAAGVSFEFFWVQMNYRCLVAQYRATQTPEARCQSCGHPFNNERDAQIEYIVPPHHPQDWVRLHARNLRIACGSCNRTKGSKGYEEWLDDQEHARLSNLSEKTHHRKNGGLSK